MSDCFGSLLKKPHAREMDLTGKPLKGFLFISEAGYWIATGFSRRLDDAVECAKSNPLKRRRCTYQGKLGSIAVSPCGVLPL
jgi:hypothetical protein